MLSIVRSIIHRVDQEVAARTAVNRNRRSTAEQESLLAPASQGSGMSDFYITYNFRQSLLNYSTNIDVYPLCCVKVLSLKFGSGYFMRPDSCICYDRCYDRLSQECHDQYRIVIRCYGNTLIPESKFGSFSQPPFGFPFFTQ